MTNGINTAEELQVKIDELERIHSQQLAELKHAATGLLDSFSPAQLIRSTLRDVSHSTDLKSAAIDTAMGLGAGFLGRKLYVNKSGNVFKKIAGTAIQFLVTNFVRNKMSQMRENAVERDEE